MGTGAQAGNGDVPAKTPALWVPRDGGSDRARDRPLQAQERTIRASGIVSLDGEQTRTPWRQPYGRPEADVGRRVLRRPDDGGDDEIDLADGAVAEEAEREVQRVGVEHS